MPPLNVMLKPVSSLCNMRCRYCFYTDEAQKRGTASYGLMTPETLEAVLKGVLSAAEGSCTVAFQGGEPTLAGLDFFRSAVELGEKYNVNRCRLIWALQTNGLTIDGDWCRFLAENRFLVGVSLDGPKEIHDENRLDAAGRGTFTKVMAAVRLLRSYKVDTNVLAVVTSASARRFQAVYGFFDREGLDFQQYIPCLDPIGQTRGQNPWSLTPERFGRYLKTAFDCWYRDVIAGRKKYHRYFDNLLLMLDGRYPEACGMRGVCGRQLAVEADGSVYPCDFYMLDEYRLGNLTADTLKIIEKRREELGFIRQSRSVDEDCLACRWLRLCRGGCRRDRDYFEAGIGKNYYCAAYRSFFEYAFPRLTELYALLRMRT